MLNNQMERPKISSQFQDSKPLPPVGHGEHGCMSELHLEHVMQRRHLESMRRKPA
jgi:hypothetical protein